MTALRILSVASEAVPLVKTGGLADVAGALPDALAPHGVQLTTLIPGYGHVLATLKDAETVHRWDSLLGVPARLLAAKIGPHPLLVLDAPDLFARVGGPYTDPAGKDWPDNCHRFAAFARAAADLAGGTAPGLTFDVVHAHDWQAAMVVSYQRFRPFGGQRIPSVVTIHNMAFQGWFDRANFATLDLPTAAWSIEGVESYGGIGFLKAGLQAADRITTVSPTYAAEIRDPEFGMGLEGVIRARGNAVSGILNGIDSTLWNPAADPAIAQPFTARTLARRAANRAAIEAEFSLTPSDGPLYVAVTRLTWQKGMDVLLEVIDHLVGTGGRLALLGSGDAAIQSGLAEAARRHPGKVGIRLGYDEALAHRLLAGGDAFLMPSRFEPCGLTQMYALAYGCVPLVSRTGGLADTVIDANPAAMQAGTATGVQVNAVNYYALCGALDRTAALFARPKEWQRIQRNGMAADFSWDASGKAYADLYRSLLA